MVAYNFQKQFVPAIERGEKSFTIRANAKRRHAQPKDLLQLYTGMRTKACRKIVEDRVCVGAYPIWIGVGVDRLLEIVVVVSGTFQEIKNIDRFSRDDGFEGPEAMHAFWIGFHGLGTFKGTLIDWGEFSVFRYKK